MILTHESGAQKDQFDEKKWRPKISWYYPFKQLSAPPVTSILNLFPLIIRKNMYNQHPSRNDNYNNAVSPTPSQQQM